MFHGRSCPDGFAAALAAWRYYGGQAELVGLDHGDTQSVDDLPPLAGRAVYILDFSFSEDILRAIEERAERLVLLDHHKSAAEKLTGFACRCGVVHFDMDKSGARLAWEFFHPEETLPDLVRYVEDRDLWNWQYPRVRPSWRRWTWSRSILRAGRKLPSSIRRRRLPSWRAARPWTRNSTSWPPTWLRAPLPVTFNGQQGLMLNAPGVFHSLLGEMLSKRSGSFALLWSAGKAAWSRWGCARSAVSIASLAESMGGGGHAQAAVFAWASIACPNCWAVRWMPRSRRIDVF